MFMVIVTWCALVPIIFNKTMELLIGIACFAALGYYGYLMAGLLDAFAVIGLVMGFLALFAKNVFIGAVLTKISMMRH